MLPYLRSYADADSTPGQLRGPLAELMAAIERGDMTAANAFWTQLPIWESMAASPNPDNNNADIANIVAGTIVQELGRATGGAFTRAIHEPEPVDYSGFQSFLRGGSDTLALNLLDEINAWFKSFGDLTYAEALAHERNLMDEMRAANPGWYDVGGLAGMGLLAVGGAALPGLFGTTSTLGRMGVSGGANVLQGALAGAGAATSWDEAVRRGFVGAALGGTLGKYTGLPPSFGSSALAGFGNNIATDWFIDRLPDKP